MINIIYWQNNNKYRKRTEWLVKRFLEHISQNQTSFGVFFIEKEGKSIGGTSPSFDPEVPANAS